MRTSVSLAASLCLMILSNVAPAQAGSRYSCHDCTPTWMSVIVKGGTAHDVPFPTRRGNLISHFDANGVPQSIVTPVDSHEELVEIPCVETEKTYSWFDS